MTALALRSALPFCPLPVYRAPFDPFDFQRHGPRDYQLDLLWQIVRAIEAGHRRILVQLPTGGGKTKLATALLATASAAQFIVHRKELIEQTSSAFWRADLPHGFVAADKPFDPYAEVLLCGIVTLAERLGIVLPPEIAVWDEAHHLNATTWAEVMAAYPDAIHIGLTATPQRLDGRGLGEHFDIMLLGPSTKTLIRRGFLSDFDYYAPPANFDDDAALLGDVVDHYLALAPGQPGLIFASNRQHGIDITAEFVRRGVSAAYVDGTMTPTQRRTIDEDFRTGRTKVLVSVKLIGEGYDVPEVAYVALACRTKSLSWFLQMVGRALRPVYADGMPVWSDADRLAALAAGPKPRAIICDHGNNVLEHGMPDDERAWTLDGRLKGNAGGANSDAEPIHQCLNCYRVTFSKIRVCPGCGTEFPTKTRNLRIRDGELAKIERDEARLEAEIAREVAARARKLEEWKAERFSDFLQIAKDRGYKNPKGWAKLKMKLRAKGSPK